MSDISIKEINRQFLSDFENYLFVAHEYAKNTVVTILKKLRHIVETALNQELIHRKTVFVL